MLEIKLDDGTPVQAKLEVQTFTFRERIKRAAQIYFMFITAALACIFIPVFHFVLVPGLILTSFVMAYVRLKQTSFIDLEGFVCPKCAAAVSEKKIFQTQGGQTSKLYCYNCRTSIYFEVKAD